MEIKKCILLLKHKTLTHGVQIQYLEFDQTPAARNGHSAWIYGNLMYVFGGDRNLISFKDMY